MIRGNQRSVETLLERPIERANQYEGDQFFHDRTQTDRPQTSSTAIAADSQTGTLAAFRLTVALALGMSAAFGQSAEDLRMTVGKSVGDRLSLDVRQISTVIRTSWTRAR